MDYKSRYCKYINKRRKQGKEELYKTQYDIMTEALQVYYKENPEEARKIYAIMNGLTFNRFPDSPLVKEMTAKMQDAGMGI